jgi:hypothetical protein
MTAKETSAIEALRNTVERYNRDVIRLLERCDAIRKDVDNLDAAVNGIPGEETAPGLAAQVKSLLQSRSFMRYFANAGWAVALLVIGALIRQAFGG